jgi:hypothetical protein
LHDERVKLAGGKGIVKYNEGEMEELPNSNPMLEYSRTLYVGGFRYKSLAGFLTLLTGILMAIASAVAMRYSPIWYLTPVIVVAFGVVLIIHIVWMIQDRRRVFRIETGGIVNNGKFVPWSEIHRFAAEGQHDGTTLSLFYETVSSPLIRHHLFLSHRLRTPEYEKLIELIRDAGVPETHPKLILGGYQRC